MEERRKNTPPTQCVRRACFIKHRNSTGLEGNKIWLWQRRKEERVEERERKRKKKNEKHKTRIENTSKGKANEKKIIIIIADGKELNPKRFAYVLFDLVYA